MFRLSRNERSHWSGNGVHVEPESVFMIGRNMQVTKLDRLARNTRHLLEISEYLHAKRVALRILNLGIDTSTPTGKLMLTMIGAIATFERELMLERQAEGIAMAKQRGVYKGRKPTAMAKGEEVLVLAERGIAKAEIARRMGISLSSVQRILRGPSGD
ncbi:recombinase family protein [Aeromonas sp. LsrichE-8G]|uniref:recombinase family protein n=1 Tax=Aeromonas sp. LsrichE-8G TaxID=2932048 RepID=UPI001FD3821E|nr:recombinase family protein [Aeromonas sp. LsrichE-8G]